MGYVKTPDEVERIEDALSAPSWSGEWLSIQFLTAEATLERLLPPPLELADEAIGTVTVGRWRSSCLGDFSGGTLNFAARYGGIEGVYVLVIYMDSEPPVVFGRELFGEPKKFAESGLALDGDRARAWVDRQGSRLIDLSAELDADLGPSRASRATFNFKARTAAGGRGLEEDAILTRADFDVQLRGQRPGAGEITLGHTVHDPLGAIEVLEARRATYGQDLSSVRCSPVATVPAEQFLPYHYGRQDDWLALGSEPAGASGRGEERA